MAIDFKQWRTDKGLSQAEAAKLIGATHSTWSLLERGKKVSDAYKIAATAVVGEAVTVEITAKPEPITPVSLESVKPVSVDQAVFSIDQLRAEKAHDTVWFALVDVCAQIDYQNPSLAAKLVRPDALSKHKVIDGLGRTQEALFISEAGLYQLLMRCRLPKAEAFTEWVTAEVLPKLRQTGSYSVAPTTGDIPAWAQTLLQGMGHSVIAVQQVQAQQQQRLEQMAVTVEQMPAAAADAALQALQALETNKTKLHDIVRAIVAQAQSLPSDDPEAQYYAKWGNAWRSVHRHAQPPVCSLKGYTSAAQIEHAILGGEAILVRLGGKIKPQQLTMDLQAVSA